MNFYIKEESINNNEIIKYDDGSFCYAKMNDSWDFQVELFDWYFTLNFESYTKKCTSCEGTVLKRSKKILKRVINIPNCKEGGLFIDEGEASVACKQIKYIKKTMYYDPNKSILAIGDIETKFLFFKFGKGQYVSLDENNQIICVIVEFKTISNSIY